MDAKLQKVADMIKKTLHTKSQVDCFDGCVLYIDEHCTGIRNSCMAEMNNKFTEIKDSLVKIEGKLDRAIGNGNGEH